MTLRDVKVGFTLWWYRFVIAIQAVRCGGDGLKDAGCRKAPGGGELFPWKEAIQLLRPFLFDPGTRARAWSLVAIIILSVALETKGLVQSSVLQRDVMTSLEQKDRAAFYSSMWQFVVLITWTTPICFVHECASVTFLQSWRKYLTWRLATAYYTGSSIGRCSPFYRLQQAGKVDNPDERITYDVGDFVSIFFNTVEESSTTIVQALSFAAVLFSISGVVCVGVVVYTLACTMVGVYGWGRQIWLMSYDLTVLEADLRYCLIRTRENAESIAFFAGGKAELTNFSKVFEAMFAVYSRNTVVRGTFHVTQRAFTMATTIVVPLMVGPLYLEGQVDFGAIAQATLAFNSIYGALAIVLGKLEALASLAVRVRRLNSLQEALLEEEHHVQQLKLAGSGHGHIGLEELDSGDGEPALEMSCVTVQTPGCSLVSPRVVVEGLSLSLKAGQSLLIAGESGVGKSSILRAIAGLWYEGAGKISMRERSKIFFLPQKPYMFVGTLREQLLYPHVERELLDDGAFTRALEAVHLGYLLRQHSFDQEKEWASILSLGEQQRINFARLLLQEEVELVLLDEGTSACDTANEARLYKALAKKMKSYVSVGHRPVLSLYHTHALWLQRDQDEDGIGPARCSFLLSAELKSALAAQEAGDHARRGISRWLRLGCT